MERYSQFQPTQFDPAGLALDGQQGWLVLGVAQNRDSGALALSNFATALEMLGGESDDVEVHRFGHWANGWFEIIIIRPGSAAEKIANDIEDRLEDYPVLDEEDLSRREYEDYLDSWRFYAARDFRKALVKEFDLGNAADCWLDTVDDDRLREFYESFAAYPYETGDDGPHIDTARAAKDCTREALAELLRHAKATA